jgi:hypothetical protein
MPRVSVCAGPQGLTGSNKSSRRMLWGASCGFNAGHCLGCRAWGVCTLRWAPSAYPFPVMTSVGAIASGRGVHGLVAQLVRAHA